MADSRRRKKQVSKRRKGKMEMWCFIYLFSFFPFKLLHRLQHIHKQFTTWLFLDGAERARARWWGVSLSQSVVDCGFLWKLFTATLNRWVRGSGCSRIAFDSVQISPKSVWCFTVPLKKLCRLCVFSKEILPKLIFLLEHFLMGISGIYTT